MSTKEELLNAFTVAITDTYISAQNLLSIEEGVIADDVVVVNGVYYAFDNEVTGNHAGTDVSPYKVMVGETNLASLATLAQAINASGVAGTDYSVDLVKNEYVEAVFNDATSIILQAKVPGVSGNSLTLSVTGTDGLKAQSPTFAGGETISGQNPLVVFEAIVEGLDEELINHTTHFGMRSYPPEVNIPHLYNSLISAMEEME